jgi:hypothetical protein
MTTAVRTSNPTSRTDSFNSLQQMADVAAGSLIALKLLASRGDCFSYPKRWKLLGAMSELYGGCPSISHFICSRNLTGKNTDFYKMEVCITERNVRSVSSD